MPTTDEHEEHDRRRQVEQFTATRFAQRLADPALQRQIQTQALTDSPDPLAREIAAQLADGTATVRQMLASGVYHELLTRGIERMPTLPYAAIIKTAVDQDRKGAA
ncbi:hypothetical protein ACFQZ4_49120 [Catellatospora coxensis]|uniref:Uncharacterized protein n=1 Tax=Catellatospora coxensis TaxID=310354 RepID=A0A8J3KMY5_9ACTN|nr:hypothetical protein [Catellatospora coxensis]GIG04025.1 hypothetical protein Cco03nite_07250 [Catellatospora coxensis]